MKKVFAFLLAAGLCVGMIPGVLPKAMAATKRTETLMLSVNDSSDSSNANEGWSWEKQTNGSWKLTLNQVNFEVSNEPAIYLNVVNGSSLIDVDIELIGENTIKSTADHGFEVYENKSGTADITFLGDGSINIIGEGHGICSESNIVFDGVFANAIGKKKGIWLGDKGTKLTIKNNSNVSVEHSDEEYAVKAEEICVENAVLRVSSKADGSVTLIKAGSNLSIAGSQLYLDGVTTSNWRWGLSAPSVNVSNTTVDIRNVHNAFGAVFGGSSADQVTLQNVNGTLINTISPMKSSATAAGINLFHKGTNGTVNVYGNATLPAEISEINSAITFKDNGSLIIPSNASLTLSDVQHSTTGKIVNNGKLIITSESILNSSGINLEGDGNHILLDEVTADSIVVPTDLKYTGKVLLTQADSDRVYLSSPSSTVAIRGKAFIKQSNDLDGWTFAFDREVKEAGIYTVTFSKEGRSISKQFTVAEGTFYTVVLPSDLAGFEIQPVNGSSESVVENGEYAFSVNIKEGYRKSASFMIMANGKTLEEMNGVYTLVDITSDQIITVTGVEQIPVPSPTPTAAPVLPKTGDNMPVALLCALAALSLTGLFLLRRRSA